MIAHRNTRRGLPTVEATARRSQLCGQAQTGTAWSAGGAPGQPYLVVPVPGQSNAFGMGRPVDLAALIRRTRESISGRCPDAVGNVLLA
jgi:hypothetical protein